MVAEAVGANGAGDEDFGRELAGRTYRIMRALARGPQNERYVVSRFYGLGFRQHSAEEIQADMRITEDEFNTLLRRGIKRLREAGRG